MFKKEILCPLCGEEVSQDIFQAHFQAEQYVLDRIVQEHPEWKESDGGCKKCMEYYKELAKE